ncbi:MAG: hypothetical protein ABEJ36_01950 [Candidatus Nanosalina sp.]
MDRGQKFQSRLGKVAVTDSHIERERNDNSDWQLLVENLPDKKLIDELHFSRIKQITYTEGSTYPYIEFEKKDGDTGKMFFSIGDPYKEIFQELKKKIAAYREAYE